MEAVRLGIIGIGAQGGLYAGFLSQNKVKGMVLGALYDIDPVKHAGYTQTFHGGRHRGHIYKIVDDSNTLNCRFVRIGMLPMNLMGSKEKTLEFAKRADEMAARLAEHGIELYYHNHHVEFQKFDGKYLLDLIKEATTKIGFELDVHWIQRGGENPVEYIKGFKGRMTLLHLKDYRIGQLDLSFMQSGDRSKFGQAFSNVVQFAEIGEGNLYMKGIIEAGLEGGSEYFLIEQDDQYGRDRFEALKISGDNLRKMGYGDWF